MLTLLSAQERATFSVKVDGVQLAATVRDSKGRIVSGLKREDFILEEEGALQEIQYFAKESDLPLTIGLLMDSSMSQRRVLQEERRAGTLFLEQVLRPAHDLAFVISFDVAVQLWVNPTGSLASLKAALARVQVPTGRSNTGIGTLLFDGVFLAADEILKDLEGRKTIILISDGVDFGSVLSQERAIEAVQRADTVIYGIRYYDTQFSGLRPRQGPMGRRPVARQPVDGKKVLEKLSNETGGRMFEVSKKLTLPLVFDRIQEELRSQYIIGYTPHAGGSKDRFRKISLRTKDKKLKVYSRSGYYPR